MQVLSLAVAQEAACRASGLPWPRLLQKRQAALAEALTTNLYVSLYTTQVLSLAVAQEAACRASGLPWPRLLQKRQAALAEALTTNF